ncbi:MAG: hypothetical protein ACI4QC_04580 [Thermoguttaceae bacterium]
MARFLFARRGLSWGVRRQRRRLTACGGGRCATVFLFRRRIAKRIANRTFVRLGALTGACAAFTFAAAVFIADYFAAVRPADWPVRDGAALRHRDDDASLFFCAFSF